MNKEEIEKLFAERHVNFIEQIANKSFSRLVRNIIKNRNNYASSNDRT